MKRWKIILPTLLATTSLPLVSLVGCNKKISVTGVFIEQGDIVRLDTNCTVKLTAIVIPTNATDKKVTWSVDESGNASVDPKTGLVTGLHDGDAVVTVTTNDGAYTDSCKVEVRDVHVTGVIIKQGEEANCSQFNTLQLECEVSPHNATNKNVTWSSDSNFASVDQNGLVTGNETGVSYITVKTDDVVNQVVLWKVNRQVKLDDETKTKLLEIKSISSIDEVLSSKRNQVVEILSLLLKTKGVKLPMASTILHFFNENSFPIIDQRAYYIAMGQQIYPFNLCNSDIRFAIKTYFEYLNKCIEWSNKLNVTISVIDKYLYQMDKDSGRKIKM